ncbi:MAG: DUF4190 domain-containing protein [Oscillospiraceae bacterium]|nr:DUF4190 domain-containing protein [Oscillospiraceae bacterium]
MYENGGGSKGVAIAAMVFGIISIVLLCCGIGGLFGIVGLILSIIAIAGKKNGKGMAIAGLIMSIISVVVSVLMIFSVYTMIAPYVDDIRDFGENVEEYAENYEETGEIPDFIEEIFEKAGYREEDIKKFMDSLVDAVNGANTETSTLVVCTE